MWLYAAKRFALALLIIVVAVTLLFGMIHAVPGDPVSVMLGPRASEDMRAVLIARMGLDQPWHIQILSFFANLLRGDLGTDVFANRPVAAVIGEQLPHTLALIGVSLAWAAGLGIPLGVFSAMYRNSWIDRSLGVLSVAFIAVPSFVVALYGLLIFAVWLRVLPAIGAGAEGGAIEYLRHLILPAFAIGLAWVGYLARMVRASMLEVLGEGHVRTARAFGLSEGTILFRYALRLAILPTITLIGVGIGSFFSSAVFAEIVFARPGIGKLLYDSVISRNYPVVMGAVLVSTALFVAATTLADLINAALDPRVRGSL